MRYLSIDIEATGLEPTDLMIEYAAVPIDTENNQIADHLTFHSYIKCPSFEKLSPKLNEWVREHNKELIQKAHKEGVSLDNFKKIFEEYLNSKDIKEYFGGKTIILFGKSLSALDLPTMTRDLGHDFMRKHFHHRTVDLTCLAYAFADMKILPEKARNGTGLMEIFEMGDVCHTALEDAVNTAILYFKMAQKISK